MRDRRTCRIHPLTGALLVGLGLAATGTHAATRITVTSASDAGTVSTCTLRQAIAAINASGGTTGSACVASTVTGPTSRIEFDISVFPAGGANLITLADVPNNQLTISSADLTIDATANGNVVVERSVSATHAFGIFYATSQGTLTLEHLTVRNGRLIAAQPSGVALGAGISCECARLVLYSSSVTGNSIESPGYAAGGGIFVYRGNLTLNNSVVSNNHVSGSSAASGMGGGAFVRATIGYSGPAQGNASILGSSLVDNSAQGNGGGLHVSGVLSMFSSIVSGNSARNTGGGMKVYRTTYLSNSTVSGNSAGNKGGGVYDASGFYGVPSALITFSYSTLSGNRVINSGGARGGGLYSRVGNLSFIDSTISGNSAPASFGYGGAIFIKQNDDPITFLQSTVAGNTAATRGGGLMIANSGAGAVSFDGTLFSNTLAPSSGGSNIAVTTGAISIAGNNNLVYAGATASGDTINTTFVNPPLLGDPRLSALGNFGGLTKARLPLAGSAAVDAFAAVAGQCPLARDQRYAVRPQAGGCDIGAVEYRSIDGSDFIFIDGFEP